MVIMVKKDMTDYFSRLTKIIGHVFFDHNYHFFLSYLFIILAMPLGYALEPKPLLVFVLIEYTFHIDNARNDVNMYFVGSQSL